MRFQGRITDWRDERGFGFITPDGGSDRVFFHIKSLARLSRRPVLNDRVLYTLQKDGKGRSRASNVEFVRKFTSPASRRRSIGTAMVFALVFLGALGAMIVQGMLPLWIGVIYVVMSAATFGVYAKDKAAAIAGRWRTRESTLHVLGLVGGWPGGLVAQQLLRHKSSKGYFRSVFWLSVFANVCGLLWFMSPAGQELLAVLTGEHGWL